MAYNSNSKPEKVSQEYRNSLGKLLDLTDPQMSSLKKKVMQDYKRWKVDVSGLHDDLQRWNDLVENVVEETDYPFEGASNIHIPVIAIYMKVYHSILRRSILAADMIWYAESDDEQLDEFLPDIEESMNFNARSKWNIAEALSDVIWTTCRDKLGILHVPYVEEYEENVKDIVYVHNPEDFITEFPPDSGEMSEEVWNEWKELVDNEATDDNPVEIPITYDKQIYRGPKAEIVELADFVIFPPTAKSISKNDAHGYGHRFFLREEIIRERAREGAWYDDKVNEFFEKSEKGSEVSDYKRSLEEIDGISRSGSKSKEHEFVSLVYRVRFKGDKNERKLLLVYATNQEMIVSVIDFPYRVDHYVLFRIGKKANRLLGDGIPSDLEDLNEEVDVIHNQRLNSRKITEVPSFKAKKRAVGDFDPHADENRWRPGVVFWLEDPDAFEQFTVQPSDMAGSMNEEANTMTIASLREGVEPFSFSGNVLPKDPDAPGNKTETLIQQANLRMDDPLTEMRLGVEEVGNICISHEYQFGPAQITYIRDTGEGQRERKTYPKRLLRTGVTLKMFGITVRMNPDAEFQKWFFFYKSMIQDPMIARRAKSRWHMLMEALKNGRVSGRDKILPPLQELEQEEIAMRAAAMKQLEAEQAEAQAGEGKEQIDLANAQDARTQGQKDQIVNDGEGRKDRAVTDLQRKAKVAKALQTIDSARNGKEPANAR